MRGERRQKPPAPREWRGWLHGVSACSQRPSPRLPLAPECMLESSKWWWAKSRHWGGWAPSGAAPSVASPPGPPWDPGITRWLYYVTLPGRTQPVCQLTPFPACPSDSIINSPSHPHQGQRPHGPALGSAQDRRMFLQGGFTWLPCHRDLALVGNGGAEREGVLPGPTTSSPG